jgi:hypothetical protein
MTHVDTFEYLKPTDEQIASMGRVRAAAKLYADILADELPEGPDKTYLIRKLREVAMWANVTITRLPDGTPRTPPAPPARQMYPDPPERAPL